MEKQVKWDGEDFKVQFDEATGVGQVVGEDGTTVTITYESGERPFNIRTDAGWGEWVGGSVDDAVSTAIRLVQSSRAFLTQEQYKKDWEAYLSDES